MAAVWHRIHTYLPDNLSAQKGMSSITWNQEIVVHILAFFKNIYINCKTAANVLRWHDTDSKGNDRIVSAHWISKVETTICCFLTLRKMQYCEKHEGLPLLTSPPEIASNLVFVLNQWLHNLLSQTCNKMHIRNSDCAPTFISAW